MLSRNFWLQLSKTTRQTLAIMLEMPKSGGCEVVGNVVTSDGYTDKDLSTVTLAKLQEFMQSDSTDFYGLLNTLISRIEHPINISPEAPVEPQNAPVSDLDLETRLGKVEAKIDTLSPEKLYNVPVVEPKKKWGRPKGSKVVNGKLVLNK